MLAGPLVLGASWGSGSVFVPQLTGELVVGAGGLGDPRQRGRDAPERSASIRWALPFWLSVATWVLAGLVFLRLDACAALLAAAGGAIGWSFDQGLRPGLFRAHPFAGR